MMIEIIPKAAIKASKWLNILLYFSLGLLFVVILSFFLVNHSLNRSRETFKELEDVLIKQMTPEKITLEQEIFDSQKKIDDFSRFFKEHLFSSRIFGFLEKISHPRIWFSRFSSNPRAFRVLVSGQTESFSTLGQQLLILTQEPLVKTISLSQISITRAGDVEFILEFSLDPQILQL